MYNNEVIDICFKKEVALLVFDLMVFLLIVFAIAEGVCLILLYHRIFYQKKQSIDVFLFVYFILGLYAPCSFFLSCTFMRVLKSILNMNFHLCLLLFQQ